MKGERPMKKMFLIALLVVSISALIFGCAPATPTPTQTTPTATIPTTTSPSPSPTTTSPSPTMPSPTTTKPGQIRISWTEQNAQNAWGPVHAEQPWLKKMEDASGGRLKFDVYWAQT